MNNFYVYIYFNPNKSGHFNYDELSFQFEPLYIGKGNNNRYKHHLSTCFNKNDKKGYRRPFYRKLRKLLNLKIKPFVLLFKENLTEQEAFQLEIELIKKIGRKVEKRGPLYNLSPGGEGGKGGKRKTKKIYVYNNNGEKIDSLVSTEECSKKYNINKSIIVKSCHYLRFSPYKELRFRFENKKKIDKYSIYRKILNGKIVEMYNLENKLLKTYNNITEASEDLKILSTSIGNNIRGLSNTCNVPNYGKCKFKFKLI